LQASWQRLIERYHEPIQQSIRRHTRGAEDAESLAEEFFSYLFEQGLLGRVSPQRGRFRAFVQAVLRRFLLRRRRHASRAIAVGDLDPPAPVDQDLAGDDERAWAAHTLRLAMERLFVRAPRDARILAMYYGIAWPNVGSGVPRERKAIAADLGVQVEAVDHANHRGRKLLRAAIEAELRATVVAAEDVEGEMRILVQRLLESYPGLV